MSGCVVLSDGRSIGYSEYGDPKGTPLLYFHGYQGSRLEAAYLVSTAEKYGCRLLGLDRPGLGLSTYQRGRHITDWPKDVAEFADRLGLAKFSLLGLSGGGPYALACAALIPERLHACAVVSGSAPQGGISTLLPWVTLPLMRAMLGEKPHALAVMQKVTSSWAAADRAVIAQLAVREIMVDSILESFRQGLRGAARDGMLNDWGFRCEDIRFGNICLWHGEQDSEVPVVTARATAARIGKCKWMGFAEEGHLSVIVNHADEIVSNMVQ